ncbi:GL14671 [Drosophila persimilis]|uniref:GL14671 n=1 Tax=Drosophila persimilis TaxID=7234 RepID=B4GVK0_DROPE|nr:GL14671 [Drosophila persimilis]
MVSKRKAKQEKDNVPSKKHKSKDDHNIDPKGQQCSPAPGGLVLDRRDPFALTAEDEVRLRKRPSKFFRMGIRKSLLHNSAINIPEPAGSPKEKDPKFLHPKALFLENIDRIKKKKKSPTPFAFVRPETPFWESIDHCDSTEPALAEKRIEPLMHPIKEENVSPFHVFSDMKMDQSPSPNVVRPDTSLWAGTNYFDTIDPVVPDIWMPSIKEEKTSPTPFAFLYGKQSPSRKVVRPETPFWESIDHCDPTEPALPEKRIQPLMHPIKQENVPPLHVFSDMDLFPYPKKEENVSPFHVFSDMDIFPYPKKEENVSPFHVFSDMDIFPYPKKEENVSPFHVFSDMDIFPYPKKEENVSPFHVFSDMDIFPYPKKEENVSPFHVFSDMDIFPYPKKEENVSPFHVFSDMDIFPYPKKEENVSPFHVFSDMKVDQSPSSNVVRPDTSLWDTDQSPDSNVVPMTLFWESTNHLDPIIISRDPILAGLPLPWPVLETIPEPKNEKLSPSTFAFPYTSLWENMDNINPPETQRHPIKDVMGFPDMDQSPDAQMLARSHDWPQNMDSFDPNECPTPTDNSNGMFPQVWTFVAPVMAVDDKVKKGPRTLRFPSKVDLSSGLLAKCPKLNNSNTVRTELPSSANATIKPRPRKGPKIKAKAPGIKYTRKPKPEPVLVEVPNVEFQFVNLCDPANEHPQELLFTTTDGSDLHVPIDNLKNSLVPWNGEAKVLYIEPFPIQTTLNQSKSHLDAIPKLGAEETEARPRITDAEEDALIAYVEALLAEEDPKDQNMGNVLEAAEGQD